MEYQELYGTKSKTNDMYSKRGPGMQKFLQKIDKLEDYIFLLDDVLDDKALKGFFSYLADYVMKCRHAHVKFIFTA